MHVIESLLRPYRMGSPIVLIAVFFTVEICLSNHYVDAVGVAPGRGDAFIRSLTENDKDVLQTVGTCVDPKDKEKVGDYCAYEITERGAHPTEKSEGTTSANALDVCIEFDGFKSKSSDCKKIYCFSLKSSVTFWVLVIGIPIAIIIAIGVIIWLCCHFSYYMCCCCIFHMELPKWFKKAQAKAKVSPEGNTAAKEKKEDPKATDASKDKGKEEVKEPKDAEKAKEETKDKEEVKEA